MKAIRFENPEKLAAFICILVSQGAGYEVEGSDTQGWLVTVTGM